ncbi:MAG: hypothetical protein CMI16_07315 [Opitutaceae bacterium]|nr:hypothetical protein [Opitutaceae bacterium]
MQASVALHAATKSTMPCVSSPAAAVSAFAPQSPNEEDALERCYHEIAECVSCDKLKEGLSADDVQDSIVQLRRKQGPLSWSGAHHVLHGVVAEQGGHMCADCFHGIADTLEPGEVDDFLSGKRG